MKRSSLVNLSPSILQPVLMHSRDSIITQDIGTNKEKPLTNWNRNSLPPFLMVKTLDLTFSTSSQNKVDWKKISTLVCVKKLLQLCGVWVLLLKRNTEHMEDKFNKLHKTKTTEKKISFEIVLLSKTLVKKVFSLLLMVGLAAGTRSGCRRSPAVQQILS